MVSKLKQSIAIFIYLPHGMSAFSSFHPFWGGSHDKLSLHNFPSPNLFSIFQIVAAFPQADYKEGTAQFQLLWKEKASS